MPEAGDLADDALHLAQPRERRKKEHHRRAQPRAEVGRAGGEVAELRVKGETELFGKFPVERRKQIVRTRKAKPVRDVLFAQVILLVDHNGKFAAAPVLVFVLVDERRAVLFVRRKLGADEVIVAQRLRNVVG